MLHLTTIAPSDPVDLAVPALRVRAECGVVHLDGDFDVRSTEEVRGIVHRELRAGGRGCTVVVDLAGVTSVDPTALKVLAAAGRVARRHDARLVLRGAGPAVLRMLHLTRLIRVVEIERVAQPA